jgi:hypothetical protein
VSAKRRREHFGIGALRFDPATSVFLNCPYDREYQSHFDAAVLATICCGFTPRSALESGTVADPRMERIMRAIFQSKYSIHDLTRCKGEGDANLARFNMPLELGIAMACRSFTRRAAQRHDWLAIVPAGHQYTRFISDLGGFDPPPYNGSERGLVFAIMAWLATRVDAIGTLSPQQVFKGLPEFKSEMRSLRKTWDKRPPWADVVLAALKIAKQLGR